MESKYLIITNILHILTFSSVDITNYQILIEFCYTEKESRFKI